MKIYRITQNMADYNVVLPGHDFFKPKLDFLKFLKQIVGGKLVIECGAGNGLLTKKMREMKINVLPIDLFERDSEFIAVKQDSTTFEYPKNSIALIARPNRGGWIHDTILRAIKDTSFVIYIGLPKHINEDINDLVTINPNVVQVSEIYKDAGEDGEVVFKISKKGNVDMNSDGSTTNSNRTKYYLVKYQAARNLFFISWFEDGGNKWVSFTGGFVPKSNKDTVIEARNASDIHELDWKKTSIYRPDSDSGWLGRDGTFIGCASQDHDLIADLILNKPVSELEKTGWVRIYDKDMWVLSPDQPHIRLSPEQKNYLSFHGYKVSDTD